MTRCVVKCCGSRTPEGTQLCERCYVMLSRGLVLESPAWFATELEFLATQNHYAMEEIRRLHDKVNELME